MASTEFGPDEISVSAFGFTGSKRMTMGIATTDANGLDTLDTGLKTVDWFVGSVADTTLATDEAVAVSIKTDLPTSDGNVGVQAFIVKDAAATAKAAVTYCWMAWGS